MVSMAAESLVPLFVGATLGREAVGGLFFSRMLAFYPFVVVAMVQRVMLPVFARLQARPAELGAAASTSLFAVSALVVTKHLLPLEHIVGPPPPESQASA